MNPFISINIDPVIENHFTGFITDGLLKFNIIIKWQDPKKNKREFQIIKISNLVLDGIDINAAYPQLVSNGTISSDTSIVQKLFKDSLDPYGIILNKISMHSHVFFESVDFDFLNINKLEKLNNIVDERCKKIFQIERKTFDEI